MECIIAEFYSDIFCLALVCDEKTLRHRMVQGRGIRDEEWIQSSIKYNIILRSIRL